MADEPSHPSFLSAPRISFTAQARQSLDLRDIDLRDIERALAGSPSGQRVARTGNVVFRIGDIRVLAEPHGDEYVVLAAFRRSEFEDHAE